MKTYKVHDKFSNQQFFSTFNSNKSELQKPALFLFTLKYVFLKADKCFFRQNLVKKRRKQLVVFRFIFYSMGTFNYQRTSNSILSST